MKKIALFALAALCAAAAQAVTINWTGTKTLDTKYSFVEGWEYTLTLTITNGDTGVQSLINATGGNPRVMGINSATEGLHVDVVKDSNQWHADAGPNPTWKVIDYISAGSLPEMTFVVTGTGKADGGLTNVFIDYIEGAPAYWVGGDPQGFVAMSDIAAIETLVTLNGAQGSLAITVPEPTALALLALGVVGLALKRKVA